MHSHEENESSYCSISSPAFGGVSALDFDRSDRCIVVAHCHSFICIFLMTQDVFIHFFEASKVLTKWDLFLAASTLTLSPIISVISIPVQGVL